MGFHRLCGLHRSQQGGTARSGGKGKGAGRVPAGDALTLRYTNQLGAGRSSASEGRHARWAEPVPLDKGNTGPPDQARGDEHHTLLPPRLLHSLCHVGHALGRHRREAGPGNAHRVPVHMRKRRGRFAAWQCIPRMQHLSWCRCGGFAHPAFGWGSTAAASAWPYLIIHLLATPVAAAACGEDDAAGARHRGTQRLHSTRLKGGWGGGG